MVKLQLKYNLNHIYYTTGAPGVVPIGSSTISDDFELELFEKSLALASDLKRLPILRGISGEIIFAPGWHTQLLASGMQGARVTIIVYNGEVDVDNIIYRRSAQVNAIPTQNTIQMNKEPVTWDYEGGILLMNKIIVNISVTCDVVAAGSDLPISFCNHVMLFEIDWVPVSKEQIQEFIVEHLYARGD